MGARSLHLAGIVAKIQITPIDNRESAPISFVLDSEQKRQFLIGRNIGNAESQLLDIAIPDRTVSKAHALLECRDEYDRDQWFLKDISRNGTKVNGVRMDFDRWHRLTGFGDIVECGLNGCGFQADCNITSPGIERKIPDEPTINATMEAAIAAAQAEQVQIDNMWEALYYSIKDIPNTRLIIYGCFVLGGLAVWLGAEVLKHINN